MHNELIFCLNRCKPVMVTTPHPRTAPVSSILSASFRNGEMTSDTLRVFSSLTLLASVLSQHSLTLPQWEERIKVAWSKLKGIPPFVAHFCKEAGFHTCSCRNQAVSDYLNIAQDLEMYGVTYFEVTNKKGTKLWLGVHNLGMDIYEYGNK